MGIRISKQEYERLTGQTAPKGAGKPQRRKGVMNRLERRFAEEILEPCRWVGEVTKYTFEEVVLRLAPRTTYTPDFAVERFGLEDLEYYEVKGPRAWDDAMVKLKVAAAMFPKNRVYLCRWSKRKGWTIKLVPSTV